jgi:hypothetical protein
MNVRKGLAVLSTVTLLAAGGLAAVGCDPEGPAERAGEEIDEVADNVDDKIDPKGPLEKAGRAIDRAAD